MIRLQRDNPAFPFEDTILLEQSMSYAALHLGADRIGASYRAGEETAFNFLPYSSFAFNQFHLLHADGTARIIPAPTPLKSGRAGKTHPTDGLYRKMNWIKEVVVAQQATRGLPLAAGFILRPRSLIVLRTPASGGPGAIFFRPDLTGHDALEEMTRIAADFHDRFEILL